MKKIKKECYFKILINFNLFLAIQPVWNIATGLPIKNETLMTTQNIKCIIKLIKFITTKNETSETTGRNCIMSFYSQFPLGNCKLVSFVTKLLNKPLTYVTACSPLLYTYDSPNRGTLSNITTSCVKFSFKILAFLSLKTIYCAVQLVNQGIVIIFRPSLQAHLLWVTL